ncbi:uncharacterized protein [Argopecten irradians]|uniref:uncharacterized protein n=1 Tax=Argopecten irradians TaxID=31199 RepID=UPI0037119752
MTSRDDPLHGDPDQSSTVLLPPDRVDRSDAVPMLTCEADDDRDDNRKSEGFLTITRKYVPTMKLHKPACNTVRKFLLLIVGCVLVGLSLVLMVTGTIRFHQCQNHKGSSVWDNQFLGTHFADLVSLNNFALEKATGQTSTNIAASDGESKFAVDGDINTCSETDEEIRPIWQVDLGTVRPVGDVMIHGRVGFDFHDMYVYIGNTNSSGDRQVCFSHPEPLNSHVLVTNCRQDLSGRYVTVEMTSKDRTPDVRLVLCEVIITQR